MAVIAPIPSFVTGETPNIVKLNQLAAAAAWVNAFPALAILEGTGLSVNNAVATALTWTAFLDRDSGFNGLTQYVAQTPGYYLCTAMVDWAGNATGARQAYFQVTTGTGNPGGPGHTAAFGGIGTSAPAVTFDTIQPLSQDSPYLYAGDYLEIYGLQSSGGALATGVCTWTIALASLGP
jgi:hypothetical protein